MVGALIVRDLVSQGPVGQQAGNIGHVERLVRAGVDVADTATSAVVNQRHNIRTGIVTQRVNFVHVAVVLAAEVLQGLLGSGELILGDGETDHIHSDLDTAVLVSGVQVGYRGENIRLELITGPRELAGSLRIDHQQVLFHHAGLDLDGIHLQIPASVRQVGGIVIGQSQRHPLFKTVVPFVVQTQLKQL